MTFGGATYSEEHDGSRLRAQLHRVRTLMADARWRTLAEIGALTGDPEASVSARLRDLRKPEHGGLIVERERVPGGRGLHRYRVLAPKGQMRFL